jgi:CubicO group peptidase (beta-lactamase class C family)
MKYQLILFAIVLASCKSPTENSANVKSIELEQLETSIDSLFNSKIGENEPGAAILLSYNGEMLIGKGFGLRDIEAKKPITSNTNMRMGSVSKQFTALAVLSLVDKGLLSLNDSINKFWPFPVFNGITVEQLINHTSGIADYDKYFNENWKRNTIVENKDVLEWFSTNPTPEFKAGTSYRYTNSNYSVLAQLVEKASGQEFSRYVKENIFEKAGMKSTNFFNLAKPINIPERAFCYERDSLGVWQKADGYFMNGIMGADAVLTNIEDYFKYDNAIQNQTIISKDLHALIFKQSSMSLPENEKYQFRFLNGADQGYAMGWFVTNKIALHGGAWKGTRTIVVKEFKRPLTIAIFLNSDSSNLRNELFEATYSLVENYLETTANTSYNDKCR